MEIAFRLLDVFTDRVFAGNQLCVVVDPPQGLADATMQALAAEIGFSETTFVTAVHDDGYDIRIFTPVSELPFAGHPTLGTAFVVVDEGRAPASLNQRCLAGEIPVTIDLAAGTGWMQHMPPRFDGAVADRAVVADAAGLALEDLVPDLPVSRVSTGLPHLMVPVRDEATLRRAARDDRGCSEVCATTESESLYLFTVRGPGDVMARMFDRSSRIGEDPATGSAAGPLGAYLATHGLAALPGRMTIAQGELTGRPSVLEVETAAEGDSWSVSVGGGIRAVASGAFVVPGL
jgi:trans-2,3-dihydro-3-hydroxyanthranilate isomerase